MSFIREYKKYFQVDIKLFLQSTIEKNVQFVSLNCDINGNKKENNLIVMTKGPGCGQ